MIGRWISPDPYNQYHSPYVGMGNRPHVEVDKDGGISGFGSLFFKTVQGATPRIGAAASRTVLRGWVTATASAFGRQGMGSRTDLNQNRTFSSNGGNDFFSNAGGGDGPDDPPKRRAQPCKCPPKPGMKSPFDEGVEVVVETGIFVLTKLAEFIGIGELASPDFDDDPTLNPSKNPDGGHGGKQKEDDKTTSNPHGFPFQQPTMGIVKSDGVESDSVVFVKDGVVVDKTKKTYITSDTIYQFTK